MFIVNALPSLAGKIAPDPVWYSYSRSLFLFLVIHLSSKSSKHSLTMRPTPRNSCRCGHRYVSAKTWNNKGPPLQPTSPIFTIARVHTVNPKLPGVNKKPHSVLQVGGAGFFDADGEYHCGPTP